MRSWFEKDSLVWSLPFSVFFFQASRPLTRTLLKICFQLAFTFDLEARARGVVRCHPVAGPRCLLYLWMCVWCDATSSVECLLFFAQPQTRPSAASPVGAGHTKKQGQATSEDKTEIAASIQAAFKDGLKALPKSKDFVETVVTVVKNNLFEDAVKTAVSDKSPANCPSKRALNDALKDSGATVDAIITKSLAPKLSAAVKVQPVWSCVGLLCSSRLSGAEAFGRSGEEVDLHPSRRKCVAKSLTPRG